MSNQNKTTSPNRAAVLVKTQEIEIQDWPEPECGPEDVIVEVSAVGLCGSDVHFYKHGQLGDYIATEPLVLGHEVAGVVIEKGARVDCLELGDRVALEPQTPCGNCEPCLNGWYNLCPDVQFMAIPPHHGAFANRVRHTAKYSHKLPNSLSMKEAAMIEPMAVGVWSCHQIELKAGESVLILGGGPIGLISAMVAHAKGAGDITVSNTNPDRIRFLENFPEFNSHDARADPELETVEPVDVVIECCGAPLAVNNALKCIKPRGRIALVGIGGEQYAKVDFWPALQKEATIRGVYRYAHVYPETIKIAAHPDFDVTRVITNSFTLEETDEAMKNALTDKSTIKAVIVPNG